MIEITQEENSRIIREGMRLKNDELPEVILLEFLFFHFLKSHKDTDAWVKFMLVIEERRGVKMKVPYRTEKCIYKKCSGIKAYVLGFKKKFQKSLVT